MAQYSPVLVDFVIKMVIDPAFNQSFHATDDKGRQDIMTTAGLTNEEQEAVKAGAKVDGTKNPLEKLLNIQVFHP